MSVDSTVSSVNDSWETVLVQPEMERGRSPLVSIPPFGAGIFKASGSTDPMRIWKQRKEQVPALLFIVSMSPPGYPSAWLRPRRARFRIGVYRSDGDLEATQGTGSGAAIH